MEKWFQGTVCAYYGGASKTGDDVVASDLAWEAKQVPDRLFKRRSRAEARGDVSRGLVLYRGVQAICNICFNLFRFQISVEIVEGNSEAICASALRRKILGLAS